MWYIQKLLTNRQRLNVNNIITKLPVLILNTVFRITLGLNRNPKLKLQSA